MAGLDLDAIVARAGPASTIPLSIAVIGPDDAVSTHASGQWQAGRPVSPDDRFYGASLAKQVTAAAIALLAKRGRIDPDAPLPRWLPWLPDWARTASVRQVLLHLGGFPPAGLLEAQNATADWTDAAALALLARWPGPAAPPGERFLYSNLGYICLARLVAAMAGMDFHDFVDTQVLAPLGIRGLSFVPADALPPFPQIPWLGAALPLSHGDGGLWTSATAFAAWLRAQNRNALGIADLVETPGTTPDGRSTDYGWGIGLRRLDGNRSMLHGGAWPGARARALRCPAVSVSIVVLSADADDRRVAALTDAILAALRHRPSL